MQMFKIEMLPNLCRHCAKHHLNKQQKSQPHQETKINKECHDLTKVQSMWLLLTTTRKKLTKFRDLISNETEHNEINLNDLTDENNNQTLESNKNLMTKLQSSHSVELNRNGASVADFSKMNGLNNNDVVDVNTTSSNGALDDRALAIQSIEMPMMMPSSLRCCSVCSDNMEQITPAPQPSNSFNLNVHDKTNPIFSLSDETNDLCHKNDGLNTNETKRNSVRTVSANYSSIMKNRRKNAYVNQRWPYAISSTMNFSHVLLICIAFMVFSIRSALVLADETPANASQVNLNLTETNGSKYLSPSSHLVY